MCMCILCIMCIHCINLKNCIFCKYTRKRMPWDRREIRPHRSLALFSQLGKKHNNKISGRSKISPSCEKKTHKKAFLVDPKYYKTCKTIDKFLKNPQYSLNLQKALKSKTFLMVQKILLTCKKK